MTNHISQRQASSENGTQDQDTPDKSSGMTQVVERNIHALLLQRQQAEKAKSLDAKLADSITRFTGSMAFIYIHVVMFGLWIVINLGWLPIKRFDPSFVVLAMFASVEAIFLSTFILISQNRMQALADKRADLDLQVNLLAEHEVTRLIQLVTAIADHMGIEASQDPELNELAQDVHPEKVLKSMEKTERKFSEAELRENT